MIDAAKAREVLADYLSARRGVTRVELSEAWRALSLDPAALPRLFEECGADARASGACADVRERLDEYAALEPAARSAAMPATTEHVRRCRPCRDLAWSLQSAWLDEPPAATSAAAPNLQRRLRATIAVALDALGRLIEVGLGPPARAVPLPVAVLLADQAPAGALDWSLADEELGAVVEIALRAKRRAVWTLHCELASSASGEARRLEHVSVRDARTRALYFASGAVGAGGCELDLGPGDWDVQLRAAVGGRTVEWCIPLTLASVPDEQD